MEYEGGFHRSCGMWGAEVRITGSARACLATHEQTRCQFVVIPLMLLLTTVPTSLKLGFAKASKSCTHRPPVRMRPIYSKSLLNGLQCQPCIEVLGGLCELHAQPLAKPSLTREVNIPIAVFAKLAFGAYVLFAS